MFSKLTFCNDIVIQVIISNLSNYEFLLRHTKSETKEKLLFWLINSNCPINMYIKNIHKNVMTFLCLTEILDTAFCQVNTMNLFYCLSGLCISLHQADCEVEVSASGAALCECSGRGHALLELLNLSLTLLQS